jgi:hypothetical protein
MQTYLITFTVPGIHEEHLTKKVEADFYKFDETTRSYIFFKGTYDAHDTWDLISSVHYDYVLSIDKVVVKLKKTK